MFLQVSEKLPPPTVGLLDLANKNTQCPWKWEFEMKTNNFLL